MELAVKLAVFEGPLDLLLHLIDKNKINIYDIPIAEITEQYLAYVAQMDREDLDLVSEFLVMAATLLDIKAKMLLPAEKNEEGEAEDPRNELVQRLLEYQEYRCMGQQLRDLEAGSDRLSFRKPQIPREVAQYRPPVDLDRLLTGVTEDRLRTIFSQALKRQAERADPERSRFGRIEKETVLISDRILHVKRLTARGGCYSFRELLSEGASKTEIVVTFLAVLELIKTGEIRLTEDSTRDDIIVEGNE